MSPITIRLATPSFQQGPFIQRTLSSVRQQEFSGLTYFVADGGSTDGTVDILRRTLRPVQWRSREDAGQTASLCEAFQEGHEEVLGWLNSDDYLLPGALRRVAEVFAADPDAAIVHGDGILVDQQGSTLGNLRSLPIKAALLAEHNVFVQPSTFMRRRWYEHVGGFDPRLSKTFDYDVYFRIVAAGGPCRYVPEKWSAFRVHPSGQTTERWKEFIPEALFVQWKYGNRRSFARRYASQLHRLCSQRGAMTFDEAREFVAPRLSALLDSVDWRRAAADGDVQRFFLAETGLRRVLRGPGWRGRLAAAAALLKPRDLAAVAAWLWQVTATGQIPHLAKVWRQTSLWRRVQAPAM